LLKLFVGSGGTLGIVTRAILRLIPTQAARSTLVAYFPTVQAAADTVVTIGGTLRASMMELMDQASINAVEDYRSMGLDRSAGALLLPSPMRRRGMCGGDRVHGGRVYDGWRQGSLRHNDAEEGELFVAARRAAFPAIEARGSILLEDVGAPVPRLPELLSGIAAVADRYAVEIPVVAHAGDGNTHPIVIYDRGDPDARDRAYRAFEEIMQLAISLGGTITGEHGVGRTKKEALPAQLGPEVMALSRTIKNALDPLGILNPGAIF
jgi:glycolate oxidase